MHKQLIRMMTMISILICVIIVNISPVLARDNGEVLLDITAIMASHDTDFIDPELMFVADEFKSLFSYSSYTKIRTYTVVLKRNQSDRVILPHEQDLVVHYLGLDQKQNIDLHVTVGDFLDTHFSLIDGGHILIGGPEYEDGVLILLFEAKL